MSELRVVAGCNAVHPEQRGGQHVSKPCSGVMVIDDDIGIGVMCNSERSQRGNRARAESILRASILTAEDREVLEWLLHLVGNWSEAAPARTVLSKLLARSEKP